jgi:hypothetical protein
VPISITVEGLAELQATLAKLDPVLDKALTEALIDSGRIVAKRAQANAPVVSGRMRASVAPFLEGKSVGGVEVTATRSSARYPSFPYPMRVERSQRFLARALSAEAKNVEKQMQGVLDEIARKWGSL